MKFINFRVIEFSIAVSGGIICAAQGWITFSMWKILPFFLFASIGFWIWNLKHLAPSAWNPLVNFTCFFLIGVVNFQASLPVFQHKHFSKDPNYTSAKYWVLQITDVLKPSTYYQRYEAKCIPSDKNNSSGDVLLRIENEENVSTLNPDDKIIIYGNVVPITDPKNPNPFEFKRYMSLKGIEHQISIAENGLIKIGEVTSSLRGIAYRFRAFLIQKLNQTSIGSQEKSIIQALVLGDKKSIDGELFQAYASAGAAHILAVSGLHVGILLLLLNLVLNPLQRFRVGKWIKMIFILLFLWTFAFVAGLSPSVVRAVTMFSLFAIADLSHRPTNSINTLFLSYFLLLLFHPNWLFQVGFQLSYLAVGSILWLQPRIKQLWRPRLWITKKGWDIITVTIAAQIGLAPLSIHYFHQFPGMFLITNIVVLPVLALVLTYGLIVILLASLDVLPEIIANGCQSIITWLNLFIRWVSAQNTFLFENISLSFWSVLFLYIFMVSFLLCLYTRNKLWLYGLLLGCILFLGHGLYKKTGEGNEWVVFHLYGKTLMTLKTKSYIYTFSNSLQLAKDEFHALKSYSLKKGKPLAGINDLPKVFKMNRDTYIILDSLGVYPRAEQAIILLTFNPKVHLARLIDSIHPKQIIADGSNYPINVRRWKSTCEAKHIPFFATQELGAYQMDFTK